MEELLLRAGVVLRTSNLKIPRRRLTVCEKEIYLNALRTWRVIIFPHSFNHIIDWWRLRCRYHLSNSLVWQVMTRMAKKCTHEQYGNLPCSYSSFSVNEVLLLKNKQMFSFLTVILMTLQVLDPTKRLGCDECGGFPSLKSHKFYEGTSLGGQFENSCDNCCGRKLMARKPKKEKTRNKETTFCQTLY